MPTPRDVKNVTPNWTWATFSRSIVFLAFFVALGFSGCGRYEEGYAKGRKEGYAEGREDGEKSGNKSGYSSGKKVGWVAGYGAGTLSFMKSRWIPSLGLAVLSALALIVLFVILTVFRLLIYPPLSLAIERVRRRVSAKWTLFDETRQRRRYLLKQKAASEMKVQIFATKVAASAQAALHDEQTLAKFENLLMNLRKEVSEQHWEQLQGLGAKWGEVASAIESDEKLHPSDKEALRREIIATYKESTSTQTQTT